MLDEMTYRALRSRLVDEGYAHDIEWSESAQPVSDPLAFWREYSWVVLNSGMKNTVATGIWRKVQPTVEAGGSASQVFGHVGKSAGIDRVYRDRVQLLGEYIAATDKLDYLRSLPWIGPITCYHLAKNFGLDCAKPDRHLVRIAGAEGTHALCARLAAVTGDRIATVDYVIWRAASLGWVHSGDRLGRSNNAQSDVL